MPAPEALLDVYLDLAYASEVHGKPTQRDKLLVLAAEVAQRAGFLKIAEDCRSRLLSSNPNHLFKDYVSTTEAFASDEVKTYTKQVARVYPFEKAEYLLDKYRVAGFTGHHDYPELVGQTRRSNATPANGARGTGDRRPTNPAANPLNNDWPVTRPRPALERAIESNDEPGDDDLFSGNGIWIWCARRLPTRRETLFLVAGIAVGTGATILSQLAFRNW